jgi:hypothetical protein
MCGYGNTYAGSPNQICGGDGNWGETRLAVWRQVDCSAGRGDNHIESGGYTWRTLDGADPAGANGGAPNNGCQIIDADGDGYVRDNGPTSSGDGTGSNYLPLPVGWVVAPNDADSIAVIAAHGWGAESVVLADGSAWQSQNAPPAGTLFVDESGSGNRLVTCEVGTVTTGEAQGNSLVGDSCPVASGSTYTVTDCNLRVLARCR